MQGVIESRAFPAWVAFCTALAVAVASAVAIDDSVPVRVAAGFVGLAGGVVLAFALAAVPVALRRRERAAPAAAPAEPVEPPPPVVDERRTRLEAQLTAADPNGDVEAWIASTRSLVGEVVPGASGYFAALGSRTFPDERSRLEAHRARLETIVRDFL